jgi:hypothetical protein
LGIAPSITKDKRLEMGGYVPGRKPFGWVAHLYYTTMTESYENLLKQAYSNITEKTESSERFVVPEAKAYV